MKIKMTNREILEKYTNTEKYFDTDKRFPIEFIWNLEENQSTLKSIVEKCQKHRNEMLMPLSEKGGLVNNNDGTLTVKEEYADEFLVINKQLEDLLNIENEIEIKTFPKTDECFKEMSLNELRAIKYMLE